MTKQQAVEYFKEHVLPDLDTTDLPLVRTAWNDYVDALQKDGQITERQADTWGQPAFVRKTK